MALRIRKDIKKSSYYVWFLGAKEAKGIRGKEYILPVIEHLVLREKEVEPFKVTLQISHKGLKIVQNVLSTNPKTSKPKNETIKHFIPHNTITCVIQNDDIVACILLLYNPVTKCPLHVHVYRCDSNETATMLKHQLDVLIDRPENQKKYTDLENRFVKPEKKKFDSSVGSDTGTSTRESESSEERYPPTTLYDSLAAELRQKLRKNTPILLPPRDYDTVHRQRGNLQGIDTRRCLTASVVGGGPGAPPGGPPGGHLQGTGGHIQGTGGQGQGGHLPGLTRRMESSGGSSGIGSDHAPSPESEGGNYLMDNQSTSDEEWNAEQTDSTLYLMHGDMLLPRPSRHQDAIKFSPEPPKSPIYQDRAPRFPEEKYFDKNTKHLEKFAENSSKRYERFEGHHNTRYAGQDLPKERYETNGQSDKYLRYPEVKEAHKYSNRYDDRYLEQKVRSRFQEDFDEEVEYRDKRAVKPAKEEPRRAKYDDRYYPEERYQDHEKIRPKYSKDPQERYYQEYEEYQHNKPYYEASKTLEKIPKDSTRYTSRSKYSDEPSRSSKYAEDFFEDPPESRRRPEDRQRSPTPPELNVSPKDRFKDAKEKFLLLERERIEDERLRRQEMCSSVPNLKDKTFLKRHESMVQPKDRYQDDRRYDDGRYQPKPAPRTILEEDRYRREPLDRYRSPERYEKNRRSMYNQLEEDHKQKSNEIAKELKRRSYLENPSYEKEFYPDGYHERDAYQFSKSNIELDKISQNIPKSHKKTPAGYRHSYAEPKFSKEKLGKNVYPDIHRTNSVSNSGRVGLASVNPY